MIQKNGHPITWKCVRVIVSMALPNASPWRRDCLELPSCPTSNPNPSCIGTPEKRMVPFCVVFADSDAVPPGTS
ncbi:hypothetical protein K0M31_013797 [Melipona bicolor]|uniref:Uncharacterized protein n=1 Tax=Melipona bicolor TaxID=60889 RepID=A0AA40KG97_9HYME|nr:hypothetical protein K0M31_013797 [Melipona bicolor]